eukprot:TRINITY_DN32257_c0_g1_i1.p1 TRINITY_DN32257_c0_g1~~TRINITY_DN32257_c0_g1_i1.p1  ORF type:complete len:400 (-),score=66.93 TRINITY_DN32257_c0_g1_i1:20-1219(-)
MRGLILVGVLLPFIAILAAFAPALRRLWRIQQVLVPPEAKDKDALRIGILGASFIAQAAVVHAASKRRDVVVQAVAARDGERAAAYAKKHGIPFSHGGADAYRELLEREDVDAVYIGLPTRLHLHWAATALKAGKHVLLEKPAVANAHDARQLLEAASLNDRLIFEAAHYRYHPVALRAKELIRTAASSGGAWPLQRMDVRFVMLDPKAWFANVAGLGAENRLHERVKNLDRWWYCADALLWATGASVARIKSIEESRFALEAELELEVPVTGSELSKTVNASITMARDRLLEPFTWSLKAFGGDSATGDEGSVKLSNFGFPFLWHELQVQGPQGRRTEQLYGEGETTFEHQLGAFVAATQKRGKGGTTAEESFLLTAQLVDQILEASGAGALPSDTLS